jgi:hypothetical protein
LPARRGFTVSHADGTVRGARLADAAAGAFVSADPPGIPVFSDARRAAYGEGRQRWWEVEYVDEDVISKSGAPLRVGQLRVVAELQRDAVYGFDLDARAREVAAAVDGWLATRWCRDVTATDEALAALIGTWRTALARPALPEAVSIVRDRARAIEAALELRARFDSGRYDLNHLASRAAAVAQTAISGEVGVLAAASKAIGDTRGRAHAAGWKARDAIGRAIHDLTRHDTAFSFRDAYTSPVYAFESHGCALLAGSPSPWSAMAALWLAGAYPIGYVDGAFVLFAPS